MSAQAWLNGAPLGESHGLAITNRGLHYGDGVFETMLWQHGRIRFLETHLERARASCERLGIAPPAREQLTHELGGLPLGAEPMIVKLLLLREGAGRGYRPAPNSGAIRLILLYPFTAASATLRVQWCASRWSRNPQLAGLKHLNRLEQVLAQQELRPDMDEGLMLDSEGELISATSGNLFVVNEGILRTADLQASGVRGVMRTEAIAAAKRLGMPVEECALWPADLHGAEEAFITNAVRGIRPIVQLGERQWSVGPLTGQLQHALAT